MPKNRPKIHSDLGFTLLELLLSLTIVAIIVVIIFGALRIGVRAWEKGEADIEINQRQRIVLGLLKRQLASISLRKIANGGNNPFLLKGDNKSMAFVSQVSMVPGNTFGLALVKYIVEPAEKNAGERLAFFEQNIVLLEEDADLDNLDREAFYTLIPNAGEIAFAYLKAQSEEEGLTKVDDVMVKDPFCETYFPERKGIKGVIEGKTYYFCSTTCRDRFLESASGENHPEESLSK